LGDDNKDREVFTRVSSLSGKNIIAIAAADVHSIALSKDGKVYGAGIDESLGLGSREGHFKIYATFTEITDLRDKGIVAIAAGVSHSLALSSNGKVYATGLNYDGQLGLGDSGEGIFKLHATFTEIIDLRDKNITAISASDSASFALSSNGKVYATGENYYGELGLGDKTDRNVFAEITDLRDKNITAISAGNMHTTALSKDGRVYAAGYNSNGELGLGDKNNRDTFTEITDLRDKNITAISNSFALSSDGKVYAAGDNYYGELGLGDENDRDVWTLVPSLSGKNIGAVVARLHSIALSKDGRIYTTGYNSNGQLGLDDKIDRYKFTLVDSFSK
jgi:alpha-tubulin suppressor-like RCC1 family protein